MSTLRTLADASTPFDSESVWITGSTLVLLGAVVVTVMVRRWHAGTKAGGRRLALLAGGSLLVSVLASAWMWQLRMTFTGGCVWSFVATPFSQDQALALAPWLTLGVLVLAVGWVMAAGWSTVRRLTVHR